MGMSEKNVQIPVIVSREVKDKLKMICLGNGQSMSSYCALAVREKLTRDWDAGRAKISELASHRMPTMEEIDE